MADEKCVIDEKGVRYCLGKQLGRGGQGATYLTHDKEILVKMSFVGAAGKTPDETYREYCQGIDEVRSLPITSDMHIAAPVYLLQKPLCGYVMRLMSGMTDLAGLMLDYDEAEPEGKLELYKKQGGLLRRLKLLRGLADILCRMREKNLVYVDLSPANVFVSENQDYSEVWLIDADNIRRNGDVEWAFGTPEFRAPEVVCGNHNTIYSDIYSYALLAHILLTGEKAFIGRLCFENIAYIDGMDESDADSGTAGEDDWGVDDQGNVVEDDWGVDDQGNVVDDDWGVDDQGNELADVPASSQAKVKPGSDIFERAEKGLIPWIDDPDNRINKTECQGIRPVTVSDELFECFNKSFSREGRNNPSSRTTPREWLTALNSSIDRVVKCSRCGWTYYADNEFCPYCRTIIDGIYKAVIQEAVLDVNDNRVYSPEKKDIGWCAIQDGVEMTLRLSHVQPTTSSYLIADDEEAFSVHISSGKMNLIQIADIEAKVLVNGKEYSSKSGSRFSDKPENIKLVIPSRIGWEKLRLVSFCKF